MSLDAINTIEVNEVMENFIARIRPDEEIRKQIDFSYRIDNQSIIIFEIRPHFMDETRKIESPVAKTTFVKAANHWKVFWFRANLKWYPLDPIPTVKTLEDFVNLVEEDKFGCFWG
jgi:hypothetical protein